MQIDIYHVAKLARLRLDEAQAEKFTREMTDIIAMVDSLPKLSGNASPLDPEHPMALRPDEIGPSYRREALLQNAPQVQAGCIVVPRLVD